MEDKVDNWIPTFTGKKVDPFHLTEEDIDINDIAHSLALQCRFAGHTLMFYSVAEHCILVADLVGKELAKEYMGSVEAANRTCLTALLHDAAEAYIGDMSRYFKHHPELKFVIELEQQILGTVGRKFNLGGADYQLIKRADRILLATEAKHLIADSGKGWYLPEPALTGGMHDLQIGGDAEVAFLEMFEVYGGKQ